MSIICLLSIENFDQLCEENIAAILKSRESHGIHRGKEKKDCIAEYGGLLQVILEKAAIQTVTLCVSIICMYACIHTHIHTESLSLKTVNTVACFILNKRMN